MQQTGYGIVMPEVEELTLEEPKILKQNGKYGIRLKATAPSIHMMKTQIHTEITPIVGSEQQSEELVMYLLKEFEENPVKSGIPTSSGSPSTPWSTRGCTTSSTACPPTPER